jgi:O-antigen ligase
MARMHTDGSRRAAPPALASRRPVPSLPPMPAAPASKALTSAEPVQANGFQKLGVLFLIVYLLFSFTGSSEILAVHLGSSLHIATGSGAAALAVAFASGSILRGFRSRMTWIWMLVLVWAVVCIPFSTWRGGSASHVMQNAPYHLTVLVVCAVACTSGQIRVLLYSLVGGAFVFSLYSIALGSMETGRLAIPDSTMLGNPNDLAFRLLLGAGVLVFPVAHPNKAIKAIGVIGVLIILALIFRTGSRGSFLAAAATMAVLFFTIVPRHTKIILVAAGALFGLLLLVTTPASALVRLALLFSEQPEMTAGADSLTIEQTNASIASEESRLELLKDAVKLTIFHPLFGVGPGEFAEANWAEAQTRGVHIAAQRAHNAYLQIASEMGIPGLLFWAGSLLMVIQANYHAYRRARSEGSSLLIAQSAGLFAYSLAFAFNSMFAHCAFADPAALIALSVANSLAIDRPLSEAQPSPPPPAHFKGRAAAAARA